MCPQKLNVPGAFLSHVTEEGPTGHSHCQWFVDGSTSPLKADIGHCPYSKQLQIARKEDETPKPIPLRLGHHFTNQNDFADDSREAMAGALLVIKGAPEWGDAFLVVILLWQEHAESSLRECRCHLCADVHARSLRSDKEFGPIQPEPVPFAQRVSSQMVRFSLCFYNFGLYSISNVNL